MNGEVIAVFLPEGEQRAGAGATMLVRGADGRMSLEDVNPDSPLGRRAMSTACFRRGQPIIDPVSRQMIGYEMELIPHSVSASL